MFDDGSEFGVGIDRGATDEIVDDDGGHAVCGYVAETETDLGGNSLVAFKFGELVGDAVVDVI